MGFADSVKKIIGIEDEYDLDEEISEKEIEAAKKELRKESKKEAKETKKKEKKKLAINFDVLQKLGKVLMAVIAVMPAAGFMISLGKIVQMAGVDINMIFMIGSVMENIGWAIINNLHILFAVAIGGSCFIEHLE